MAWIKTLGSADDPDVKAVYDHRMQTHGYWPNVLAAQTLRPRVLRALMAFQEQLTFGGSSLGRRKEELISFYVSALNECQY